MTEITAVDLQTWLTTTNSNIKGRILTVETFTEATQDGYAIELSNTKTGYSLDPTAATDWNAACLQSRFALGTLCLGVSGAASGGAVTYGKWQPIASKDEFVAGPNLPTTLTDLPAADLTITAVTTSAVSDGAADAWTVTKV